MALVPATPADREAMKEVLINARYALELWEREAIFSGDSPQWAKRPLERGSEEIARLADAIMALSGSLAPANPTEKGEL